ncbi:MAG: class I SAM-dependent methyltransferase [Betaproteobacteria bacterium]|nr:class I SAM-dependent methyltransferase [Betaproteobacteria bacterium]
MSGFDNPRETWDARFAGADYHFGTAPNAFVAAAEHRLPRGASVLSVADGEGRNSVWLAKRGHAVTAFDIAPQGVAKAARLAAERGVAVELSVADILHWPWDERAYDAVVAIFIQFLPPASRSAVFAGLRAAVRPGGLVLLQGYRPEQVDYGTGGPPRREHMYTAAWLRQEFAGWEILQLAEHDSEIEEGRGHRGRSALVDLVARRPAAA